jgi:Zn-dependent protease with chaperone function
MTGCLMSFGIGPDKAILMFLSVFLALLALAALKKFNLSTKSRVGLIYAHLSFLFFPFILYSVNITCGAFCMSCYNNITHMALYALPTTLVVSTLVGFVVIPVFYTFSNKKREIKTTWIIEFVRKYSKMLNFGTPKLYAVDRAKPMAFSFRSFKSAIFMSVGLLDIMNKKEIKAVLLHEMAHIKQKSSIIKLSNSFLRVFSPLSILARFNHDSSKEEMMADRFAVTAQGTDRYLLSAKRKIDEYEKDRDN